MIRENSKSETTRQFEVAVMCHRGHVRAKNQDQVLIFEDEGIYLLADGMGGHTGGEIASRIAVETTARELKAGAALCSAILTANAEIKITARDTEGAKDMGTTIVAMLLSGTSYQIAWVGDSRAYKINTAIEQITTDHSMIQELVDQGIISKKSAQDHPNRNVLTRALGGIDDSVDLLGSLSGELKEKESLLMCSDGLHSLVSNGRIGRVVTQSKGPQAAARKLLKLALDAGGTDNISIIIISPARAPGSTLQK